MSEKHGQQQAGKKYALPESTVRGLFEILPCPEEFGSEDLSLREEEEMKKRKKKLKRGERTMMPAETDEKLLKMTRSISNVVMVIDFHIVVGLATGIVLANDRILLKENGGTVKFTVGWCQSIFKRLNFVRKKSTTVKPLIAFGLIKEIGFSFYKEIHELVKWFNIPKELAINIDQTPLRFVLVNSYTTEKKGDQCVPVAGTTESPNHGYIWCKLEWRFLANTTCLPRQD